MRFDLDFLKTFFDRLGVLLGSKCEIVVHDLSGDLNHTIVYIVNGEVSGRKVGGCPTNLFFERLNNLEEDSEEFKDYYTTTADGRVIRSCTTFIYDGDKIVGAVCVNIDISDVLKMAETLQPIIGKAATEEREMINEHFVKNVQDLLDVYLADAEALIGKPGTQMNRQEKLVALAYLDQRGVFQISKAHVRLCEFFDISKYTLYNYLDAIRNPGQKTVGEEE